MSELKLSLQAMHCAAARYSTSPTSQWDFIQHGWPPASQSGSCMHGIKRVCNVEYTQNRAKVQADMQVD